MLVSLNVKNFAIIDNIDIEFKDGMTVLTGETGAGKSLIIDAIGLLFGSRASIDLIRYGESKATICGVFTNYDANIKSTLQELGIDFEEEDNLIIKREIYSTGKSICKINNEVVSLNDLQKISSYIGDIHSQEDSFGLINPKNYISFLKNKKIEETLLIYQSNLKEYNNLKKEYNDALRSNEENLQKLDFLRYQNNEFKMSNLSLSEEEDLKEEAKYLNNFSSIQENINNFKEIYDNQNALDLIYESLSYLSKLKAFDKKYEELYQSLEDSYYNIENVINNNALKISNVDFDENKLEEINSRLGLYSDLKRKYKKTTPELIEYANKIKSDLDSIDNFDNIIDDLKIKCDQLYNTLKTQAYIIRNERINLAKDIQEKVLNNLFDLELKNTKFEIEFNEIKDDSNLQFNKDGIDSVDFLVTFNKGELVKPLSKVASGGELSRFMLALKCVLGDNLPQQTKIFDEIDTGVSGSVAYAIALKIKEISKKSQVLCITHLAQVASISDYQLKISKHINDNRTFTDINELNNDERINEIASMLSNGKISDASINMAKELLNKK